jgi:GT2 family glycosyltransferase
MAASDFEVVVVDNNSKVPVERASLSWSSAADLRVVRETRPGLVYARIAGLKAARADLIVYADDDNALDADYLDQALRIERAEPSIGCFGGIARPVLEAPMAAWKRTLLAYLGTRHYGAAPVTSTNNQWGEWEPIGAGMVCRRAVAEEFAQWVDRSPLAARLGRTGRKWMSGEDTLMAMSAYKLGYACSYQPSLKLSHWIRKDRLRLTTLARILMGHGRSFVLLEHLKGNPVQRLSMSQAFAELRALHRIRVESHGRLAGTFVWFRDLGFQLEARHAGPHKVQLGSGWYPLESFQGEQFRWVNNDAVLYVGPRSSNEEPLTLEIAPGPGLGGAPLVLRVLDRRGRPIQTIEMQTRGIVSLDLPANKAEASYRLHVEGGGRTIPTDSRILNFRVFKIGCDQRSEEAADIIVVGRTSVCTWL